MGDPPLSHAVDHRVRAAPPLECLSKNNVTLKNGLSYAHATNQTGGAKSVLGMLPHPYLDVDGECEAGSYRLIMMLLQMPRYVDICRIDAVISLSEV